MNAGRRRNRLVEIPTGFSYGNREGQLVGTFDHRTLAARGHAFVWAFLLTEAMDAVDEANHVAQKRVRACLENEHHYYARDPQSPKLQESLTHWSPLELTLALPLHFTIAAMPGSWRPKRDYEAKFAQTDDGVRMDYSWPPGPTPGLVEGLLPEPRNSVHAHEIARVSISTAIRLLTEINDPPLVRSRSA